MARVFRTLADYADAQDSLIGKSDWMQITQERIDAFANATGDHQWIHVDPDRARSELDMPTIAHGYLTLSLLPGFMSEIMTISSVTRALNYGSDKIRFINMVPVLSEVRGSVYLKKAVLDKASLRAHTTVTVEIEGQERPALVAETITLYFEENGQP